MINQLFQLHLVLCDFINKPLSEPVLTQICMLTLNRKMISIYSLNGWVAGCICENFWKKKHSPAISVGSAKAIILDTKISLTLTKSYIPCMNISSFTADSTDQRPTVAWPYDVCCQQCRTSNEVCNDLKNINDTDIWCRNCPQWILSVWSPKKFFHSVHSSL